MFINYAEVLFESLPKSVKEGKKRSPGDINMISNIFSYKKVKKLWFKENMNELYDEKFKKFINSRFKY